MTNIEIKQAESPGYLTREEVLELKQSLESLFTTWVSSDVSEDHQNRENMANDYCRMKDLLSFVEEREHVNFVQEGG